MKKILLVEDTDSKAEMILCECSEFQVTRCVNLYEAMMALRAPDHGFVAVITDWVFPYRADDQFPRDFAGERIYNEAHDQELPVIVVSNRETVPPGFSPWIQADKIEALQAWLKKIERA